MSGGSQPPRPDDGPDDGAEGDHPRADVPFDPFAALAGMDLGELFRVLQSPGPVNWEVARQCATALATTDPESGATIDDPTPDAARVQRLVDLVRIAQTHVAAVSGLAEVGAVPVRVVGRDEWTRITLEGLRPVVEALSTALTGGRSAPFDPTAWLQGPDAMRPDDPDALAAMLGTLAPLLFGVQAGSLVGLLAQHALAQHDLPLPLTGAPQLAFLAGNIDAFATDWEIDPADLDLALALREVVRSAPRSVRWVRERLVELATAYVSGYELRPEVLEDRFADLLGDQLGDLDPAAFDLAAIDPTDPSTFPQMPHVDLDPSRLLEGLRSPAQAPIRAELARFASVLEGYADTVVQEISATLSPTGLRVDEALRRHRVEQGQHTRFVEQMLGLELDRAQYEAGAAFCAGVVERAGLEGLNRLWERAAHLPTANELEAPGLWLARLDLDLD